MADTSAFERRLGGVILASSLLLLVLLHWPMLIGGFYVQSDTPAQNLAVRAFYQQALRNGDNFLWIPSQFCGFYIHGEGQGGFCHPFHLLLYRFVPLVAAISLETLIPYIWSYCGTYLLLRHRFKLPYAPSLFGAMSFALGGFNLTHYGHINAIAVVSHLPWLLYAADVTLRSTERYRAVRGGVGVALLLGSQLLLGYPFYFFCSLLLVGAYSLWVLFSLRGSGNSLRHCAFRAGILLAGLLVGLLIGMIQIYPTQDMLDHSVRDQVDFNFRMSFSSHPGNIASWWSPLVYRAQVFFTDIEANKCEDSLYFGVFGTLCLAWIYLRRYWKEENALDNRWDVLLRVSIVGAVFTLIMAFGYYGYLYRWMSYLPVFNKFRCSGRYSVMMDMAASVFLAISFADLLRLVEQKKTAISSLKQKNTKLWPLFVPLGLSILTLIIVAALIASPTLPRKLIALREHHLSTVPDVFFGVVLVATMTTLVMLALRGSRNAIYGIVVIACLDQGFHFWTAYGPGGPAGAIQIVSPLENGAVRRMDSYVDALQVPPRDTTEPFDGRLVCGEYQVAYTMRSGHRLADGYGGLFLKQEIPVEPRMGNFVPEAAPFARRLANVRWIRPQLPNGSPDTSRWIELPDRFPRVRMADRMVVTHAPLEDVQRVDLSHFVLLPTPLENGIAPPEEGTLGEARMVEDRPGRITVAVKTPTHQILVLSESHHPGWGYSVDDGPRQPSLRAYCDYQGALVPPGEHRVTFTFTPQSFETGKKATILGLILAGLAYSIWGRLPRRQSTV